MNGEPWRVLGATITDQVGEPGTWSVALAPEQYPALVPAGAMVVVTQDGHTVVAAAWHPYDSELNPGDTLDLRSPTI